MDTTGVWNSEAIKVFNSLIDSMIEKEGPTVAKFRKSQLTNYWHRRFACALKKSLGQFSTDCFRHFLAPPGHRSSTVLHHMDPKDYMDSSPLF